MRCGGSVRQKIMQLWLTIFFESVERGSDQAASCMACRALKDSLAIQSDAWVTNAMRSDLFSAKKPIERIGYWS